MYHINLKQLKRLMKKNNFEVKQNIKVINSQIILIKMLASGITLQEAAYNLNTTHNNIKKRTQNLYKKFGVNSRKTLIIKCIRAKIISYKDIKYRFRKRFIESVLKDKPAEDNKVIINLTKEEINVLKLLVAGYKRKQIIECLGFYNMYYCNYVIDCICRKLRADNIMSALIICIKNGIIKN